MLFIQLPIIQNLRIMATINFFVSGKKRDLVPIYVRVCAGRKKDFIVPSGFKVDPQTWSNTTQTIKQRIRSDDDNKFIENLAGLKKYLDNEIRNPGEYSKEWLQSVIDKYHNKKSVDAKDLNGFIEQFINESETHIRHNQGGMNFANGTIRSWKVFKRNFFEFQGIYSDKRLKWRNENDKTIRPRKIIDFEGVTIDFYHSFVRYLTDEGFRPSTIGRHIKELKMFMKKSLEETVPLHNNREFERKAFKMLKSESFSVYLTKTELDKIYNLDLKNDSEMDIARDAFLVLCETALRISDYQKVDLSIRKSADGTKLIYITQSKTGGSIVIPLSARLDRILQKYDGKLPKLPDQYINKRIKIIARMCEINEVLRYEVEQYGKRFETTKEKWELVTCHTARRSACTNMYLAGIPTISIMQISGHRTEKIFLNYIKVRPEENAIKLSSHAYFNDLKAV